MNFYPRSPCGERRVLEVTRNAHTDFYPRSPCGERPSVKWQFMRYINISIHALLAESDIKNAEAVSKYMIFLSTLSLRRATVTATLGIAGFLFLSTLSLRRATKPRAACRDRAEFLSTLSLRRATVLGIQHRVGEFISIHALLAESDATTMTITTCIVLFLSTLSLRRATGRLGRLAVDPPYFYPRSPCGERPNWFNLWGWAEYFYPRSPCGERPVICFIVSVICLFLSTLSLRRATVRTSIPFRQCRNFYPRSPCGERLSAYVRVTQRQRISIHALLAESDVMSENLTTPSIISIHALLAESD